jgi:site-specific recombinase XerC
MINRDNWKAVNKYLKYRLEVDQVSEKTQRLEKTWLRHLLEWADDTDFSKVSKIRPAFPKHMSSGRMDDTGKPLSKNYLRKVIGCARNFLEWLSKHQSGYSTIKPSYLDTLQTPRMESSPRKREAVTLDEVIAIAQAPTETLRDERIQAAAAFWFLSGIRAGAFVTLPIKAVDITDRSVKKWPSLGVKTKFRKHSTSFLLEIPELITVVKAWDEKVRKKLTPEHFWFANFSPTTRDFDPSLKETGKYRSDRARKDLKDWLNRVDLPYHSPHKFRHGHAVFGLKRADDFSDLKAVSQNLGHASISTTDQIYSILSNDDVKEKISGISQAAPKQPHNSEEEKLKRIREILNE